MIDNERKLNKNTIKPVLRFLKDHNRSMYRFNTQGANIYHFTLDKYKGVNSFTGGFAWSLDGCYPYASSKDNHGIIYDYNKPYDKYALDMVTGKIYNLFNKNIIMVIDKEALNV